MERRTFLFDLVALSAVRVELMAQQPVAPALPHTSSHMLINGYQPKWWKEAVVYQIYPRSFQDSDGDGIGDLNGITSRLDYLQQLGVNVIWLCPHFDSPNADNGYDIRDYRKVMPDFGTMADFDRMLAAIKQRKMRLIIDLVMNHSSDEHHWFQESRKSKDNSYRDYYIWRPGQVDAAGKLQPPNNYPSFFFGSAWKLDPATNEFYLHYFAEKQPDLNWENPKVRQEVYSLMRFWLDKGVDGFRMDVIPLISKQPGMPDLTPAQLADYGTAYANGPHMHEYLQEMNREVLAKYDDMTVGEALGISLEQTPLVVSDQRHELNMIFNFDVVKLIDKGQDHRTSTLPELKAIYTAHAEVLDKHCWDTVFLANHDNPRLVSTFGDDSPEFRVASAKLLAAMLLTLRGTTFLYQGDELGMTNYPFKGIADFDDIEAKNAYKSYVVEKHVPEEVFFKALNRGSRDNARTPMQWDGSANGGFTKAAKPWLAVNPNYKEINAAAALADPHSIYRYTQALTALRAKTPALVYGDYEDLDPQHAEVFVYVRSLGSAKYLVIHHFSGNRLPYKLPGGVMPGKLLLSNYDSGPDKTASLQLRGWETRIYEQ